MRVGGLGDNDGRGTQDGIGAGCTSCPHGDAEIGGVGRGGRRCEVKPARLEVDESSDRREPRICLCCFHGACGKAYAEGRGKKREASSEIYP